MTLIQPTDVLVAAPRLRDPRFRGSVLLMLSSSVSSGSVALCLNKPQDVTTDDLDEFDTPGPRMCHDIHWGGPVSPESIWLLHNDAWRSDNTLAVGPGVRVSSDPAMIEEITQGRGPAEFRLMSGFTSWAPGQLEQELAQNWLVMPNPGLDWILDQPVDMLWQRATEQCVQVTVDSWL